MNSLRVGVLSLCMMAVFILIPKPSMVMGYQAFDTNDMSADDMFQLYMKDSSHLTDEEGASLPPLAITKRVILDCSEVNWKDDAELVRYASRYISQPERPFKHRFVKRAILPRGVPLDSIGLKFLNSQTDEIGKSAQALRVPQPEILVMHIYIPFVYKDVDDSVPDDELDEDEGKEVVVLEIHSKEPPQFLQWPNNFKAPNEEATDCLMHAFNWISLIDSEDPAESKFLIQDKCFHGKAIDENNVPRPRFSYTELDCANRGILQTLWTAVNDFGMFSTVQRTDMINDIYPPRKQRDFVDTLCFIDSQHINDRVDTPPLCPSILIDQYLRTNGFRDNCDPPELLKVKFLDRQMPECLLVNSGSQRGKVIADTCKALMGPSYTDTTKSKTATFHSNQPLPFTKESEQCIKVPNGSKLTYHATVADVCRNKENEVTIMNAYFVESQSGCPPNSFMFDSAIRKISRK